MWRGTFFPWGKANSKKRVDTSVVEFPQKRKAFFFSFFSLSLLLKSFPLFFVWVQRKKGDQESIRGEKGPAFSFNYEDFCFVLVDFSVFFCLRWHAIIDCGERSLFRSPSPQLLIYNLVVERLRWGQRDWTLIWWDFCCGGECWNTIGGFWWFC